MTFPILCSYPSKMVGNSVYFMTSVEYEHVLILFGKTIDFLRFLEQWSKKDCCQNEEKIVILW